MKYTVKVIQQINKDFLQQWQKLWESSSLAHFFNSPQWFLAYCKAYSIKKYTIITIETNGQLQTVLPLITTKHYGIPMLCSPGGKFLDKSSLLLSRVSPPLIKELTTQLMNMGNFYLHELSSELANIFVTEKSLVRQPASINYYVPMKPDPLQFVSTKQKNKIANRIKKHKDHLRYVCYVGDSKGFTIALAIQQKSIKQQKGMGTFTASEEKVFFKHLLHAMPHNIMIDIIYYDDRPVVYQIGFTFGKIYQGVNTAYDLDYRFLSPGKVLLSHIFDRMQKEGMDVFDFSRGDSVIKREFTKLSYQQYDVFYTHQRLTTYWLLFITKAREIILHNKMLYGGYLFLKKRFL